MLLELYIFAGVLAGTVYVAEAVQCTCCWSCTYLGSWSCNFFVGTLHVVGAVQLAKAVHLAGVGRLAGAVHVAGAVNLA
jgi:hypothetical protein